VAAPCPTHLEGRDRTGDSSAQSEPPNPKTVQDFFESETVGNAGYDGEQIFANVSLERCFGRFHCNGFSKFSVYYSMFVRC
jgi:hypothetical protein